VAKRLLLLLTVTAALAVLTPPPVVRAAPPPGFFGISPQSPLSGAECELMAQAGVRSVRLPLVWSAVQPQNPSIAKPQFSAFDREVRLAAEHGISVLPFLWGAPSWAAPEPKWEPVRTAWQRWGWIAFLRDAVARYGPQGSFWQENPTLPFLPIRRWEIWNEENLINFSYHPDPSRYARLIRLSGRVLHRTEPGSKVIVGGLFGDPLQTPPNVSSTAFLSELYRNPATREDFDAVALHPYVASAEQMRGEIRALRGVMGAHHDAGAGFSVTELGWGSAEGPSRWEVGPYGQAEELDQAFSILAANRVRWRIGGVWWFSWTDREGTCSVFCTTAGLLTAAGEAKPAWYAFNAWTGGDPETVPLAQLPAR
jgi:hypothetical protein